MSQFSLAFLTGRDVKIACPANDISWHITITHARLAAGSLRIGAWIWQEKAVTIWHLNAADIFMAQFKIIINDA